MAYGNNFSVFHNLSLDNTLPINFCFLLRNSKIESHSITKYLSNKEIVFFFFSKFWSPFKAPLSLNYPTPKIVQSISQLHPFPTKFLQTFLRPNQTNFSIQRKSRISINLLLTFRNVLVKYLSFLGYTPILYLYYVFYVCMYITSNCCQI